MRSPWRESKALCGATPLPEWFREEKIRPSHLFPISTRIVGLMPTAWHESDQLLELYDATLSEERHYWNAHHGRVRLLVGIISVVFAAVVGASLTVQESLELAFLWVGPALILLLARFGRATSARYYQQFLEIVTRKAKLQHALGMDLGKAETGDEWWTRSGALVAARHLVDRHIRTTGDDRCVPEGLRAEWDFVKHRLQTRSVLEYQLFDGFTLLACGTGLLLSAAYLLIPGPQCAKWGAIGLELLGLAILALEASKYGRPISEYDLALEDRGQDEHSEQPRDEKQSHDSSDRALMRPADPWPWVFRVGWVLLVVGIALQLVGAM